MRAAGWTIAICLRMVAPSLVITTSPDDVWIILSMPLGPRDVRIASLTALAADKFERLTSSGLSLFLKARNPDLGCAEATEADMVFVRVGQAGWRRRVAHCFSWVYKQLFSRD